MLGKRKLNPQCIMYDMQITQKKKKKGEEEEEDTRSMHMCKHRILSELLKIIIIITKQRIKLFKK